MALLGNFLIKYNDSLELLIWICCGIIFSTMSMIKILDIDLNQRIFLQVNFCFTNSRFVNLILFILLVILYFELIASGPMAIMFYLLIKGISWKNYKN